MSDWIVVKCLLQLRDEFNAVNPDRDKGADGTIGDSSHTSSSDHTPDEDSDKLKNKDSDTINEVHALDIDSTGPWPQGVTFYEMVMTVIDGEKKKWLDSKDKCRLKYAIYDHKLYSTDNDFNPVPYTGSDPHTNHAHFSARYETSCENDVRPFGVEERYGFVDKDTLFTWLDEYYGKFKTDANGWKSNPVGQAVWNNQFVPNPFNGPNQKSEAYDLIRDTGTSELSSETVLANVQATVEETQKSIDDHVSGIIEGEETPNAK